MERDENLERDSVVDTQGDTKMYSMTCSCGQRISVDAENREDAVRQIKNIMDEDTIEVHMREKHPGEPLPTVHEVHQMIEQNTVES